MAFPGNKILAVHPEEEIRIQAIGQFIERLGKSIFLAVADYRFHESVVDIKEQDHIDR